ncbi:hypothetical protein [Haloarcula argentinensis]|uniref:hypothetical protein n=1 Tax=Haloarcula argentinensis TaxID=43776 RepID=UPI000677A4C2|nr:hypothetical protein [Haloarcula argentinensis]
MAGDGTECGAQTGVVHARIDGGPFRLVESAVDTGVEPTVTAGFVPKPRRRAVTRALPTLSGGVCLMSGDSDSGISGELDDG